MARRDAALLAGGAALGALLAVQGLVRPGAAAPALGPGVVATVDGQPISRDELERAAAALGPHRKGAPPDDELRRHVLGRLVDEQLLVGYALEVGLAQRDPRVRADLGAAAIALATARSGEEEPGEADLRAFFAAEAARFRRPPRLRLAQAFFRAGSAEEDAAALARARRAGRPLGPADPEPVPLPDALLPAARIEELLGPTVAAGVLSLPEGAVSGPLRGRAGYHVVEVRERADEPPRSFEEARDEVLATFRRRAAEAALRRLLDERRAAARVEVAPELR